MVQSELHPEDEGRENDGDSGQPQSDQAAPGVSEVVGGPSEGAGTFHTTVDADGRAYQASVDSEGAGVLQATVDTPSDLRTTYPGFGMAQVKEELIAWVKTLVSAAVYAILIVTFGFQVARVEGQSMAPTLEDQDRLIVNKLV